MTEMVDSCCDNWFRFIRSRAGTVTGVLCSRGLVFTNPPRAYGIRMSDFENIMFGHLEAQDSDNSPSLLHMS